MSRNTDPTIHFKTDRPTACKIIFNSVMRRLLDKDPNAETYVHVAYNEQHSLLRFRFTNDLKSNIFNNRLTRGRNSLELHNKYIMEWLYNTFVDELINCKTYKLVVWDRNDIILDLSPAVQDHYCTNTTYANYAAMEWIDFPSNAVNLNKAVLSIHPATSRSRNYRMCWTRMLHEVLEFPELESATFDYDGKINRFIIQFNRTFDYHQVSFDPKTERYGIELPASVYKELMWYFNINDLTKVHRFHLTPHPTLDHTAIIQSHVIHRSELI